jgi:hypothetical protein
LILPARYVLATAQTRRLWVSGYGVVLKALISMTGCVSVVFFSIYHSSKANPGILL